MLEVAAFFSELDRDGSGGVDCAELWRGLTEVEVTASGDVRPAEDED